MPSGKPLGKDAASLREALSRALARTNDEQLKQWLEALLADGEDECESVEREELATKNAGCEPGA